MELREGGGRETLLNRGLIAMLNTFIDPLKKTQYTNNSG
jgi:hypothetical protein